MTPPDDVSEAETGAVRREDLSGERISVDYADRDREMAYATVREGKVIEGAIYFGPKYDDPADRNLALLREWARDVERAIQETKPQEVEADDCS